MNIQGMLRLEDGTKEPISLSGYEGPHQLSDVFATVRAHRPKARVILFIIPKKPLDFKLKETL